MKKLLSTLLLTLIGVSVQAQNNSLACQDDAATGFLWENGRWVTKSFKKIKFILIQTNSGLTIESVAKAMDSDSKQVSCRKFGIPISCTDETGSSLFFDPRTLKGGVSHLFGSTNSGIKRDSVEVQVFSCTPL